MSTYYVNVYKDSLGNRWPTREKAVKNRDKRFTVLYMIVVKMKK